MKRTYSLIYPKPNITYFLSKLFHLRFWKFSQYIYFFNTSLPLPTKKKPHWLVAYKKSNGKILEVMHENAFSKTVINLTSKVSSEGIYIHERGHTLKRWGKHHLLSYPGISFSTLYFRKQQTASMPFSFFKIAISYYTWREYKLDLKKKVANAYNFLFTENHGSDLLQIQRRNTGTGTLERQVWQLTYLPYQV